MLRKDRDTWVAALRSGQYQQARKQLCVLGPGGDKAYCCLGLLCEVVKPLNGQWVIADSTPYQGLSFRVHPEHLAPEVGDLRLPHAVVSRMFDSIVIEDDLIMLNDREQRSFTEIADWIEKHIKVTDDDTTAVAAE